MVGSNKVVVGSSFTVVVVSWPKVVVVEPPSVVAAPDVGTDIPEVVLARAVVDVVGRTLVVVVTRADVVEVDAGTGLDGPVVVPGELEMTMLSSGGRLL